MNKTIVTDIISAYEKNQHSEIVKWQQEEPGVVAQATNMALKPVSWVVSKVIPTKAISGALVAFDGIAQFLTDTNDIKRDGGVNTIDELRHKDLQLSDKLANQIHNWANGVATAEGMAAGTTGLIGMVVDIPALITMSMRVIHKIGLCYGYECNTEADKKFILAIMSAAGANTIEEKAISVSTLQSMSVVISKTTWKKMAEKAAQEKWGIEAAILAIRSLAKRLGINLTKRKALQAIPVVGAGVGAAMNLAFINDVAWAARRTFQERWVLDNGKIVVEKIR
jgi:hypothetical protein